RYTSNGSLDSTFNGTGEVTTNFGGYATADSVAIQADGKIVAAGHTFAGGAGAALARYNSDGSLDTSFGNSGKLITTIVGYNDPFVAIQGSQILLAGSTSGFTLARLNTDGSLDTSFGIGGTVTANFSGASFVIANDIAVQGSKIVVAGYATNGSFAS